MSPGTGLPGGRPGAAGPAVGVQVTVIGRGSRAEADLRSALSREDWKLILKPQDRRFRRHPEEREVDRSANDHDNKGDVEERHG
ncbi:hypothetical protein VZT92_015780 [Zoarces viviparus]|uniref:Uncharacterized protein n=1 Tax=Zoarces viviparus TaxID=48416 RepID=A0AAW1EWX8_ZOAVI